MATGKLQLPDAYIYLYHTDEYFILPQYPLTLTDSLSSRFSSQNALARTAPMYSYAESGPRSVQVTFDLHRDMMTSLNYANSSVSFKEGDDIIHSINDDYIDILAKKLQAIALPKYDSSSKMVDPPMVAIKFADTFFIKGVVTNGVTITYEYPILSNNKYAKVGISFTVEEVQPYDAESIGRVGSFRGLTSELKNKITKTLGA